MRQTCKSPRLRSRIQRRVHEPSRERDPGWTLPVLRNRHLQKRGLPPYAVPKMLKRVLLGLSWGLSGLPTPGKHNVPLMRDCDVPICFLYTFWTYVYKTGVFYRGYRICCKNVFLLFGKMCVWKLVLFICDDIGWVFGHVLLKKTGVLLS